MGLETSGEVGLCVGNLSAPNLSGAAQYLRIKCKLLSLAVSHISSHQRASGTEEAQRMTWPVSDLSHPCACTMGCEPSTREGWGLMGTYFRVLTPWRHNSEECSKQPLKGFLVGQHPVAHSGNQLMNQQFTSLSHVPTCSMDFIGSLLQLTTCTQTLNPNWEPAVQNPL